MDLNNKLFSILNYSHDLFLLLSKDFSIQELNSLAEQLHGWQRSEVLQQNYFDLCTSKKIQPFISSSDLKRQEKGTTIIHSDTEINNVNGDAYVITWRIIKLLNGDFIIIGHDITKQRLAETKLISTEDYLKSIMQHIPGYVFWKNRDSVILGCNANFARIANETTDSIIGKTDYELPWKTHQAEHFIADDKEVIKTGKPKLNIEETMRYSDGTEAVLLTHKMPLRDKNGNINGVIGIFTDITQRKRFEEELRIAKERAELANVTQIQFIQNMEHDLRTPASGVSQILKHLAENEIDTEKKDILQKLANASQRLLDLLNDIIAFDKINSGQQPVEIHKFDLYEAVNSVIDMNTPSALNKHIELHLNISRDIPQNIISDKTRILRILLNLVGNAVKFTKEGYVKVTVEMGKKIDAKNFILKLVVEDTGIGIPDDKRHRIYERFERCIPSNKGLYPGSGLGLSITKQFIDELHGEIEVKSKAGEGSTFTCLIPCSISLMDMTSYDGIFNNHENKTELPAEHNAAEPAVISTTSSDDFSKFNILVVEDDALAQMSARNILEGNLHTRFSLAKTGQDAFNCFKKNKYDIIFMDLGLPDIPGNDVAAKIRESNQHIPIIALTAHDKPGIRNLCQKAGMNDFLVKPLEVFKAAVILQRWLLNKDVVLPAESNKPTFENNQVLNFEACLSIANGNKDTAKQIWQIFSGQQAQYLNDFENAYKNKDIKMLFNLSHKLKGGAIYAGAFRLKTAASELCEATRFGNTKIDDVICLYKNVCNEITAVSKLYEELGY